MNLEFINVLALVWVVYIFSFNECFNNLRSLKNRFINFLAISGKEKSFEMDQYNALQAFGEQELIDFGLSQKKESIRFKRTQDYSEFVNDIKDSIIFLSISLILFTLIVLIYSFYPFKSLSIFINNYIFILLIQMLITYLSANNLNRIKFIEFKNTEKDGDPVEIVIRDK